MPLRVRGRYLRMKQELVRLRLERLRLFFRFELYHTNAPGVVLFATQEVWDYPLVAFEGLTPAEVAHLILNLGYVQPLEPLPPGVPPLPPGSEPEPDPPPMTDRKQAFIDFLLDARNVLQIDPVDF